MAEFEYGPVELHLIGFEGDRPAPGVIAAITDLIDSGLVRLLDFIIVSKSEDGEVTAIEIDDDTDRYGFGGVELAEIGIAGTEDIEELAAMIPAGSSAAVVAYEMAWAKRLAQTFAASGSVLLHSERIPAPVVNALLEAAQEEE
ncbi:putative membrane protein [Microbacterium halimionae]|uniref:Putative membrane protein n=1 Tax=Microbacterium halimionae TaxID=1526413 RepID=A0A7W3PM88_9MICO|nr:DUF6325 family protein [Microbacterium halimionae]MBA8816958.1 putative membrane protein [Microbacterium halimionae]NII94503.1 putative membrane protein [Microbacterium halimionae]